MNKHTQSLEFNSATGLSKVTQYGWELRDSPGQLAYLNKSILEIDHEYQRKAQLRRVLKIASKWRWIACGVIIVAKRQGNSKFFVVDGQHRVMAALRRDDIRDLPCLVFETSEMIEEAEAFAAINTQRRLPTSLEMWGNRLARRDEVTVFANSLVLQAGRVVSNAPGPGTIRCLTALMRATETHRIELSRVWPLIVEVCSGRAFHERLFEGLFYIEVNLPEGQSLMERRWRERVFRVGYQGMLDGAQSAATFYRRGGARVWALGILESLNKGCRILMKLRSDASE